MYWKGEVVGGSMKYIGRMRAMVQRLTGVVVHGSSVYTQGRWKIYSFL